MVTNEDLQTTVVNFVPTTAKSNLNSDGTLMVTYKITPEMHFMMLVQGEILSNQQTWLTLSLLTFQSNNITNRNRFKHTHTHEKLHICIDIIHTHTHTHTHTHSKI